MVKALLDGILFDGTEAPATYTIGDDGLDGWFDGVDSRVTQRERPRAHGLFPTRGWTSGRVITLTGRIHSSSGAGQEEDINVLSGLLADGEPSRFTVDAFSGSTWANVVRLGTPDISVITYGSFAAYQVSFLAADPRRYADANWQRTTPASPGGGRTWPASWPLIWGGDPGSDGRVNLSNTGRAPSHPVFRLAGGFDSALITCANTGARIGYDRPVPAGSVVEIDVAQKRAVIDGQTDVSRWLLYRDWEAIPAGATRSFQFDAVNPLGAYMDGRVFPAWW